MGKNVNKATDEAPALTWINKDKILGEVHEMPHIKFLHCIPSCFKDLFLRHYKFIIHHAQTVFLLGIYKPLWVILWIILGTTL